MMEEDKELHENIDLYEKILSSERELIKVIIKELTEVGKAVTVERKTVIDKEASTTIKYDETDLISKEQVMVSISRDGYMKRASIKAFNAAKTNGLKENDSVLFLKEVSTLDTLILFTTLGNFIYLPVHKIAECKFKDVGTFINSVVAIAPKEKLISCFAISKFDSGDTVLLCTAKGAMKQTLLSEFNINRYTKPVRAMKLSGDDVLVSADIIDNPLEILVFTKNCEGLRFRANEISLYGCNAGGVKAINLRPKDVVVSAFYANKEDDFLLLTTRYTLKRMRITDIVLTRRARAGSTVIKPVKTNPIYLVDAAKMTPNQFKENVMVDIRYLNGNDQIEARSLKYNVSDTGRSIQIDDLVQPEALWLPKPNKPDDVVSGDYLIEVRPTLFNLDDGAEEEKPLVSSKKQDNILDELTKILENETKKEPLDLFSSKLEEDSIPPVKEKTPPVQEKYQDIFNIPVQEEQSSSPIENEIPVSAEEEPEDLLDLPNSNEEVEEATPSFEDASNEEDLPSDEEYQDIFDLPPVEEQPQEEPIQELPSEESFEEEVEDPKDLFEYEDQPALEEDD
ncbi:MAG: hypothetical protein K2N65_02585, partial [Anaeroplasmataceae bacterium]|nr:hypothetical protein [Anaeroplasmataceae bacterium]